MKIIIPMAGRGSRFQKVGFTIPKPFIEIAGRPMVSWAIDSVKKATGASNKDFIFVLLEEHKEKFNAHNKMKKIIPEAKLIYIPDVTEGAAATAYLTKNYIDKDEEIFLTDSDQFFKFTGFKKSRERALKNGYSGIIGTFKSNNPGYSYIELDNEGYVTRTVEKEPISEHAAIGAYYFTKSKYFMDSIKHMMDNNLLSRNEYYVCPVYNYVRNFGKVIISDADFWMTMGTPEEKNKFEKYMDKNPNL